MDYGNAGTSFARTASRRLGTRTLENLPNRVPDAAVLRYTSCATPNQDQWVAARFSPHAGLEYMIALGDENGRVTIGHAEHSHNAEAFRLSEFQADERGSVIMDLGFLDGRPNALVTLSGGGEVQLWDLHQPGTGGIKFKRHDTCARSFSSWPNNPNCFVTGSRDGSVIVWDLRMPRTANTRSYLPLRCTEKAHPWSGPSSGGSAPRIKRRRNSSSTTQMSVQQHYQVTAVQCAHDDNHYLSASTNSASGVRLWDLRYQKASTPIKCYEVPQRQSGKQSGVASMCIDRHQTNFYAASTDNSIYEYSLVDEGIEPVNSLYGTLINTFYVQCRACPSYDYLLCGSSQGCAYIWDIQEGRRYKQDGLARASMLGYRSSFAPYLPYPKFRFNGHRQEVFTVDWSAEGRYLLTLDTETLRVWDSLSYSPPEPLFHTDAAGERQPWTQRRAVLNYNGRDYDFADVSQKEVERPQLLPAPPAPKPQPAMDVEEDEEEDEVAM